MPGKIIKKIPGPSNFFEVTPVYISMKKNVSNNNEMRQMFNLLAFLFWPMSPKQLQPIKIQSPSKLSR